MNSIRLSSCIFLLITFPFLSWSKKDTADKAAAQVLIIGLPDNVKSNYFYKEQIAEATGIQADSIDQQYNSIISNNIIAAAGKSACSFIPSDDDKSYETIISKIEVTGDGEECNSNLSKLSAEELQMALDHAHANYLLVLNQHYLKWQSQPMRTVYHMVSYTLYDKNKKAIYTGNQYFASMSLQKPDKVSELSRKSTSKIASAVIRSLDL